MIRLGQYRFDHDHALIHDPSGRPVPLRSQSARVLAVLAGSSNRIVSRDELIRAVWNGRAVTDDSVAQCIRDIRRALGDKARVIVQTHHRKGYRLVAAPGRAERPSIAVLPFANSSGSADKAYLADGIAEDIITGLGRCRWLRVIARGSTFTYRERSVDVRQVAGELDARYVLGGSVRQHGERLRVTAQLADGLDGAQLWSERYDRRLQDIFDLQDEIASVIVGTIEPELEMRDAPALRNRPVVDLGAWECYQRALWHLYRFAPHELAAARDLLERAIELDPSFAQAHARLAYVHIQLGWYGPHHDRAANVERARRRAVEAVRIDGRDPAARLSLGRALTLCGQAARGVEELRAAVSLDPSFAQARFALAQAYCFLDRHTDALPEIDEALRLSPQDPHMWTFLHVRALAGYQAGDLDAAEADARAALRQSNRTHWPCVILIAVLGRQGRTEAAADAISELHAIRPGFSCADLLRDLVFGTHVINSPPFVDRVIADLRAAGLPER